MVLTAIVQYDDAIYVMLSEFSVPPGFRVLGLRGDRSFKVWGFGAPGVSGHSSL